MRDDLRVISEKYDQVLAESGDRPEIHKLQDFWAKTQKWILSQPKEVQDSFNQAMSTEPQPTTGPRAESPFGPEYRNVPGYRPGNRWQDENYRAVQGRGW